MLGLVSPRDIHDAVTAARRIERFEKRIAESPNRRHSPPDSVERLLASPDARLLRPEMALLSTMDRISEANEERRSGRRRESAFDLIISAKVAAALAPVYSGPNAIDLDLATADPFSTSTAFTRLKPRLNPKALAIAEENGFHMDEFSRATGAPIRPNSSRSG